MLRTPVRRLAVRKPISLLSTIRSYHSRDHKIAGDEPLESQILTKSLEYVPTYGFNSNCITRTIRDLNYPDSLQAIISKDGSSPEFKLMLQWLIEQRKNLEREIKQPESEFHNIADEYDRVSYLIKKRLELNEPVIKHLTFGISQLVIPYYLSQSMEELHNLSDDIAFFAGDGSNDFAWYSKRMGISSIYVSSELYQLTDTSKDFKNTKKFVDDKVQKLNNLGNAYNSAEQWGMFNAISLVNLIRSQLVRG
ncbi:COQ9-domain-containing protein [Scheffersomyces coipomensis]|uniref:COQ9-domain-containing protein n=1 Tax=Scheffersomyces coipomensis TaxID=1788519 RepID=UPI00315DE194